MAKARLKPSEDSVAFTERELFLANGPIKVGRSVGDLRPAPHNAYFHCKVLSRNHALIWYDTALQRFYVRDTKSSNGTFVNKQKIGPLDDGSECPPFEIFSGDVMQFGVEVQEATKKEKDGNPVTVTHGCITTQIKLFNPDGSEFLPPPSALDQQQQHLQSVIATQDLYILNKYLKEAKEREVEVEKKLSSFLDVIQQLEKQAENGCDNVIREDYLLSKIEILEAQVAAFSNSPPPGASTSSTAARENGVETVINDEDDAITLAGDLNGDSESSNRQRRINELNNIKQLYEQGAKEYLNRAMLEKLEALDHVARVETELGKCQSECEYLKNNCLSVEAALKDLIQRHQDQLERSTQLLAELKDAEQQKQQLQQEAVREKRELEARMDDANAKVEQLSAQVSEAVAESTILKDQVEGLEAMRTELLEELEQYRGKEYCDESAQTDLTMLMDSDDAADRISTDAVVNGPTVGKNIQDAENRMQMSLLADESSIHSTPSNRSDRKPRARVHSNAGSSSSMDDVGDSSPFGENLPSWNKNSGRKSAELHAADRRSTSGRSITPLRTSSRQNGLDVSGADSSTASFAFHEQQSVEQFLDSVGDLPSKSAENADGGEKSSGVDRKSFLPSFNPETFERDDTVNSPYVSPPLSPPPALRSPHDAAYARQDTLVEARSGKKTMQSSAAGGGLSPTTASVLESRLKEIEEVISNVASHNDACGASSSSSLDAKWIPGVSCEHNSMRYGSSAGRQFREYKDYILGAVAAAGVGFAWFTYQS